MSDIHSESQYDVALSFAGEDREYVDVVANGLRSAEVKVFYDNYEQVSLWGKDLYSHLDFVYRKAARYCIVFISEHYARKVWTNHERQSAQARALNENDEYVLPVRFDSTDIPGIRPTVAYLDLRQLSPESLVELIRKKLGPRRVRQNLPLNPDRLYEALKVVSTMNKASNTLQRRQWSSTSGCNA
ncbi:toll/interleukin-1 receptor domain-containing protein [Micromonospora sp. DT231]|uniref:toll/interleukin-1 receptor domain-containing protein n=1 Tax=Micromonospora sp. DT231 TaxID=3416526 RepID=UPI003CF45CE2